MKKFKLLSVILIFILLIPLSSCSEDSVSRVTAISLDSEVCTLEPAGTQLPVIIYHYGRYRMRTAPYDDFWYLCDSPDATLYVQDEKIYAANETKPEYAATLLIVSKFNSEITARLEVIKQKIDLKDFTLTAYGGKTRVLPERNATVRLQTAFRPTNATDKTVEYEITESPETGRSDVPYAIIDDDIIIINAELTDSELKAGIGENITVTAQVEGTSFKSSVTITVAERTEIFFPYQLNNIRERPADDYILKADLDMSSFREWTPIPQFYGTLIGDKKTKTETEVDENGEETSVTLPDGRFTISNLRVRVLNSSETGYFGLFGTVYGAVKNIDFDGIDITATYLQSRNKYVYIGAVCGALNRGTIQNAEIRNVKIDSGRAYSYVGGIAGAVQSGGRVLDCTVTDTNIATYGNVGGVTATLSASGRIERVNVTDSEISFEILNQNGVQNRNMGGIAGAANGTILNSNVTDVKLIYSNNSFMNLTDLAPRIGIIAGLVSDATLTGVGMENTEIIIGGLGVVVRYEGVLGSKEVEYVQYRYCHSQNALKTLGWYVYGRSTGKPKITVAI